MRALIPQSSGFGIARFLPGSKHTSLRPRLWHVIAEFARSPPNAKEQPSAGPVRRGLHARFWLRGHQPLPNPCPLSQRNVGMRRVETGAPTSSAMYGSNWRFGTKGGPICSIAR